MIIDIGNAAAGQLRCYVNDTNITVLEPDTGRNDGNWHFVACVLDRGANKLSLYTDGTLEASVSASALAGLDLNAVSTLDFPLNPYLAGFLGGVRMYATALTVSEIRSLYAEGAAKYNVAVK